MFCSFTGVKMIPLLFGDFYSAIVCLTHLDGGEVADVEENWNQHALGVVNPIIQMEEGGAAYFGPGPEQIDRRDGKAKREDIFEHVLRNKDIVRANRINHR